MMSLRQLMQEARSCRRFLPEPAVSHEQLITLIDCARLAPSSGNLQPLRYRPITGTDCQRVLPCLQWAALMPEWAGPQPEEQPTAYLLLCTANETPAPMDVGIAAAVLQLAAHETDLGACMFQNVDHKRLHHELQLPDDYSVRLVMAFGHPAEIRQCAEVSAADGLAYWRDHDGVHHVPKLRVEDVII